VLLRTLRGNRLEAHYVLAITAGLRQGELLGLKREDLDLERGTLQVRRTLTGSKNGSPNFGKLKTAKGKRSVKLTEKALDALKRHREVQHEEMQRLAGPWQEHGLIFTTQIGTPINRHNFVTRSFKPFLDGAGLPDTRFHNLRHTCTTLMLCGKIHPKVVQELLGHTSVTVTLDTYSHVLPTMQGEAAGRWS
jgi:integrase